MPESKQKLYRIPSPPGCQPVCLFCHHPPHSRRMSSPEDPPPANTLQQVLEANRAYAGDFGDKAKLVGAPSRRMAILTCMDARMDPARFSGVREGDAHVIRNAGGRASDDAI